MTYRGSCLVAFVLANTAFGGGVSVQEEISQVVLGNDRLRLGLGKEAKGAMVFLVDNATGRQLAEAEGLQRILTLKFTEREGDGKQFIYVSNGDAQEATWEIQQGATKSVVYWRLSNLGGRGVDCLFSVSVSADEALVRWRLEEVSVPQGLVLEEAQFPIFVLRTSEGSETTDAAVMGHTKGGVFHRPASWKTNTTISAGQPGSMAVQFGCYYDEQVGVYSAAYDAQGYPKGMWMRRTDEGLELSWRHFCFEPTRYAMTYDVVTTTFASSEPGRPTDWRDAADIYRAWAEQQSWCARKYAEREDLPAWLKRGPAMVRFTRDWLAEPERIERWLKEYWLKRFPQGTPLIVAYWGWEKVASWVTPDYFPVFPSDEQFRELARMNRELGGHVFLWPSGYHYTLSYNAREDGTFEWDDRERFNREVRSHAVVQRDSATFVFKPDWLRGGENSCMCPGDPWTIDWLNDIAVRLVERGADMIQVDQVVGGSFRVCYLSTHGHPPGPGLWQAEVFRRQLTTMLQRIRALDPRAVVCFEEPNEHFIQYVAVQDYRDIEGRWGDPQPDELASVFNYVYHEYLPTFQSNPRANNKLLQAYCLINGQIPHFRPSWEIGPGPLLGNGDFEEWRGETVVGWDRVGGWQGETWHGTYSCDRAEKHRGKCSIRLESSEGDTVQVSRNLNVSEAFRIGGTYRLSAWMKSRELAQPNRIALGALTRELVSKGSWALEMPSPAAGWVQREVTFTVPAGTDFLRIMMHIRGRGVVWVDDMRLEEIGPDGTASEVMRPEVPPDHELMRQWVTLYTGEGRPYLLHGRMLHPPKLECAPRAPDDRWPAILHNAYRAPNGREAVILVNVTDIQQNGLLTWHGKEMTVKLAPWEVRLIQ